MPVGKLLVTSLLLTLNFRSVICSVLSTRTLIKKVHLRTTLPYFMPKRWEHKDRHPIYETAHDHRSLIQRSSTSSSTASAICTNRNASTESILHTMASQSHFFCLLPKKVSNKKFYLKLHCAQCWYCVLKCLYFILSTQAIHSLCTYTFSIFSPPENEVPLCAS